MSSDILDRLRDRDPAANTDAAPPEHVLQRIVAEPRTAPSPGPGRRRHLARRGATVICGLAIAAAALVAISVAGDGRGSPDLAARAYAQTEAGDQILHVVTELRQDFVGIDLPGDGQITRMEKWTRGDEAHTILSTDGGRSGMRETYDQLLGPDGAITNQITSGERSETQTLRGSDDAEARQIVADSRADFVQRFRARYERGELDAGGTTTFAGREAKRYVVHHPGAPDHRTEYYIDAQTGAPLGSVQTATMYAPNIIDGKPQRARAKGRYRYTETVKTLERLPVDAQGIRDLRTRR